MDSADELETQRQAIADGCRILAREGLVTATLGHISARAGDGMLLRTRGPDDRGLQFATADDIKLVPLDAVEGQAGTHRIPVEAPLHGETLRRHRAVGAVVHAHPPAVVACTIAGLPLLPIVGAYDIPASRTAHLAELTLMVAATGEPLKAIAEEDFAELPDLGPGVNDDPVWRHYLARARLGAEPAN